MHYIYKITNLLNQKVYIGQTTKPKGRWSSHRSEAKKDKSKLPIHKAIRKYGTDNFLFELIASCQTQENTDYSESQIIIQYDSRNNEKGYNLKPGGNVTTGWHHSPETKIKISLATTGPRPHTAGENNPFYGKQHSLETIEKISQANTGKKRTEEQKQKMSIESSSRTYSEETCQKHRDYQTGRKYSDDARAKMSAAKKGKPSTAFLGKQHSEETKAKISAAKKGKSAPNEGKTWKLIDGKRVWFNKDIV
jgi:group I intron endonuclease